MPGSTFYPDISAHTPAFSLLKTERGFSIYIVGRQGKQGVFLLWHKNK